MMARIREWALSVAFVLTILAIPRVMAWIWVVLGW